MVFLEFHLDRMISKGRAS